MSLTPPAPAEAPDTPPLVSVYLPTKDRLGSLRSAVASVLVQTCPSLELIVVNDGSGDGTADYLDALARQDARVRVIHHERPRGAPASRNEALRQARGTWATGLDDDDEFRPGRIEAFVTVARLLQRHGIAFSALYSQDEVLGPRGRRFSHKPGRVELQDLFGGNRIGNQIFALRETYLAAGLYDERLPAWQDLDLNMRIVERFGPALLVDAPYYVFNDEERPDRISRKKKEKILEAYQLISRKWPQAPARWHQALYLQALSPHYRLPLAWSDIAAYLRLGVAPKSIDSLLRLLISRLRT